LKIYHSDWDAALFTLTFVCLQASWHAVRTSLSDLFASDVMRVTPGHVRALATLCPLMLSLGPTTTPLASFAEQETHAAATAAAAAAAAADAAVAAKPSNGMSDSHQRGDAGQPAEAELSAGGEAGSARPSVGSEVGPGAMQSQGVAAVGDAGNHEDDLDFAIRVLDPPRFEEGHNTSIASVLARAAMRRKRSASAQQPGARGKSQQHAPAGKHTNACGEGGEHAAGRTTKAKRKFPDEPVACNPERAQLSKLTRSRARARRQAAAAGLVAAAFAAQRNLSAAAAVPTKVARANGEVREVDGMPAGQADAKAGSKGRTRKAAKHKKPAKQSAQAAGTEARAATDNAARHKGTCEAQDAEDADEEASAGLKRAASKHTAAFQRCLAQAVALLHASWAASHVQDADRANHISSTAPPASGPPTWAQRPALDATLHHLLPLPVEVPAQPAPPQRGAAQALAPQHPALAIVDGSAPSARLQSRAGASAGAAPDAARVALRAEAASMQAGVPQQSPPHAPVHVPAAGALAAPQPAAGGVLRDTLCDAVAPQFGGLQQTENNAAKAQAQPDADAQRDVLVAALRGGAWLEGFPLDSLSVDDVARAAQALADHWQRDHTGVLQSYLCNIRNVVGAACVHSIHGCTYIADHFNPGLVLYC
jgi:hypothetical protein